jgi:hypothetical protein
MGVEGVIQWEVLDWHFGATVHTYQAGNLAERMPVAAGFALELEVGEDVEGLSSCHRVMFVALEVLAQ